MSPFVIFSFLFWNFYCFFLPVLCFIPCFVSLQAHWLSVPSVFITFLMYISPCTQLDLSFHCMLPRVHSQHFSILLMFFWTFYFASTLEDFFACIGQIICYWPLHAFSLWVHFLSNKSLQWTFCLRHMQLLLKHVCRCFLHIHDRNTWSSSFLF